ncbi:hypothetical protein ABIA94_007695 [Bradyrhizobium sp. LA7.1]
MSIFFRTLSSAPGFSSGSLSIECDVPIKAEIDAPASINAFEFCDPRVYPNAGSCQRQGIANLIVDIEDRDRNGRHTGDALPRGAGIALLRDPGEISPELLGIYLLGYGRLGDDTFNLGFARVS